MRTLRTAILISGRGSNMVSLIEASQAPDYPADIKLVISNRPMAPGLTHAKERGVKALCLDHTTYINRREFEKALHAALTTAGIELVCCAGFMRVLTPWFVSRWSGRLINIHPSLLPKYKGLNTHQRALNNGDSVHGCTVHYVTEDLDSGAIIAQAEIEVFPEDTAESLAGRMLPVEHKLYAGALKTVCGALITPD